MSTGMKVLNVLGIIVSIFVSIVLVLTLTVSPMVLSALSLLQHLMNEAGYFRRVVHIKLVTGQRAPVPPGRSVYEKHRN